MGYSEQKTDIVEHPVTVNYDDNGREVSRSEQRTDIVGRPYTETRDTGGSVISTSEQRSDIVGHTYTETRNSGGSVISTSEQRSDIVGHDYTETRDSGGSVISTSERKSDIVGHPYTKHYGDVPGIMPKQSSSTKSSRASRTYYGDSSAAWEGRSDQHGKQIGKAVGKKPPAPVNSPRASGAIALATARPSTRSEGESGPSLLGAALGFFFMLWIFGELVKPSDPKPAPPKEPDPPRPPEPPKLVVPTQLPIPVLPTADLDRFELPDDGDWKIPNKFETYPSGEREIDLVAERRRAQLAEQILKKKV
jgi:hypothetical protein